MSLFDTLAMDSAVYAQQYEQREQDLREALLRAQLDPARQNYPTLIVVAGLDGAGKGDFAHALNKWMDPRGIETNAFWEHSDEESSRPQYWRYWRRLPPKGEIGIFLGSWYTPAIAGRIGKTLNKKQLAAACDNISQFERLLCDDDVLLIKLWFHVSRKVQRMQLNEEAPREQQNPRVASDNDDWKGRYKRALKVAERVIADTDNPQSPWRMIAADDRYHRNLSAGEAVLQAMREHAARLQQRNDPNTTPMPRGAEVLRGVDLAQRLSGKDYRAALRKQQDRLQDLAWAMRRQRRSTIAVFEGWDAAGKGSAIRRVTQAIDPRLFKLVQFAAPTDEERAHHYLWRFWRHLQRDGRATFFDRSWYGRILVERVEGFAREDQWQRAYREINEFEQQLADHGCAVAKFWLHISPEEQLKRFKDREEQPHKRHKITPEDWRNRDKWTQYERAVNDMVHYTSSDQAPWTLVAGNDKRHARIHILRTLCNAMEQALE